MKVNPKALALMALLAAGSASAAGTVAGIAIKNTAEATFTDPGTGSAVLNPVKSNEVVTTVLPLPVFDLYYKGDTTDGGANDFRNRASATDKLTSPPTVPANTLVSTVYTAVNTGNAQLVIDIAADTDGGGVAATYYAIEADVDKDGQLTKTEIDAYLATGKKALTSVTLAPDASQDFFQVFTASATAGSTVGASPEGTVAGTGTGATGNGYASGTTGYEDKKAANADLQYVKVTVYQGNIDTNPPTSGSVQDPDGATNVVTPPPTPGAVGTTPGSGTVDNPTSPNDTPGSGNVPSVPGYLSGTTPIVISGDEQRAYPAADSGVGGTDSVTFTNVVTNSGSLADDITVKPTTVPSGATALVSCDGGATWVASCTISVGAKGSATETVAYLVKVTYPDADTSTGNLPSYAVVVTATSGKDATTTATTTDTVYPPAMNFGDSNGVTPGAVADQPANDAIQVVDPSKPAATSKTDTTTATDSTASFAMNVENTGAYNDSYTLSATVPSLPGAVVKYHDASGVELSKNTAGQYITPVVEAGREITVYAVVEVPAATLKGDYAVNQSATSNYSGITLTDTDDVIRVGSTGGFVMAKFVNPGTTTTVNGIDVTLYGAPFTGYGPVGTPQQPTSTLRYAIFGKNTFNGPVSNVVLRDAVPTNTTYGAGSAQCAVYKDDGTLNTAKTCTASLVSGSVTSSAVTLEKGESVGLTFEVKID